jgi:cytochrome c oxidase subunit 3
MAQAHAESDKYYIPHGSPWPIFGSITLFTIMSGAIVTLNDWLPAWSLLPGFTMLALLFIFWFHTVIGENQKGIYNMAVDRSFRLGMMWFIFSEVMFFAAFFGALFYARNFSVPWLSGDGVKVFSKLLLWNDYGGDWPTNGPATLGPKADGTFETIPALGLPLLNTAILLSSSVTVTIAHHALITGHRTRLKIFLAMTFLLGFSFVTLQATEYHEAYTELGLISRPACDGGGHHADGDLVQGPAGALHAQAAFWLRSGRLVLALRRRGLAWPVLLRLLAVTRQVQRFNPSAVIGKD